MEHLVFVSVSQVLATTSIITLLLLNVANYLHYGVQEKLILSGWALFLLLASYLLYRKVRHHVDFLDYMSSLLYYHLLRRRSKILDATNTLLFLGLILITISPFIHTYLLHSGHGTLYAVMSLFLGGAMVGMAVSGYVLLEEE